MDVDDDSMIDEEEEMEDEMEMEYEEDMEDKEEMEEDGEESVETARSAPAVVATPVVATPIVSTPTATTSTVETSDLPNLTVPTPIAAATPAAPVEPSAVTGVLTATLVDMAIVCGPTDGVNADVPVVRKIWLPAYKRLRSALNDPDKLLAALQKINELSTTKRLSEFFDSNPTFALQFVKVLSQIRKKATGYAQLCAVAIVGTWRNANISGVKTATRATAAAVTASASCAPGAALAALTSHAQSAAISVTAVDNEWIKDDKQRVC